MANSVEGRVPFLDHRVIEFAGRLPPQFKLRGLKEKRVLRHAARGLLPESVLARVKQPYRAPDSRCFFVEDQPLDFVADLLSPARINHAGYFDTRAVGALVEKCRAGKAIGFADNMAFVGVLSTMILDDVFIRGSDAEQLARVHH
jgi:asparagine synthase (glutamine-hydrolysing)